MPRDYVMLWINNRTKQKGSISVELWLNKSLSWKFDMNSKSCFLHVDQVSGAEGAIPFSNSLSVAEQPRIEHALRQADKGDSKHSMDMIPFRHGTLDLPLVLFII